MRLPGAVGIDFRDRKGVRRGAIEILTSLMLVYVANLGMDYVVCGPGAIAGPATHRSSSSASRWPCPGHNVAPCPSVRSIHRRDESRQLYRCRPQKNKGFPNAQNCEPGAAG